MTERASLFFCFSHVTLREQGIGGRDATPFLLGRISELTKGESLEANMHLIQNNAMVGAQIAVELSQLLQEQKRSALSGRVPGPPFSSHTAHAGSPSKTYDVVVIGGCLTMCLQSLCVGEHQRG